MSALEHVFTPGGRTLVVVVVAVVVVVDDPQRQRKLQTIYHHLFFIPLLCSGVLHFFPICFKTRLFHLDVANR